MAKNANKHGLRAETIVAATENVEAFRDLSEAWYAAYEPRSPGQIAALDRCVYYTWQFHRIVSAEAAVIDEQVNSADVVWMRDQQAQVAAHRATLAIDPEAALCGLNETAAGCRWQISEWTVLKSALDEDGCWYAASHRDRAVRLFGLRPEQTTNEMVYWLSLINLCARDEPDARALAWYLEGASIPDTLRRKMRDGAPGRDACVRELRARVDDELTVLKGREE